MTTEDYQELMEEPAGGENHGWRRNPQGGWTSLNGQGLDPPKEPSFVGRDYHGREYGYRKMKCRCVLCRAWKSMDNARRYSGTNHNEKTARGSEADI